MLNIETLLSVFDKQGTLLKWLQKLEEALKNATLSGVTVLQPTATTAVLTFEFSDGTKLEAAPITLPRGLPGKDGEDGAPGKDGNGIVSVTTIGFTQGTGEYEGYTVTNLNVDTDDETIPIEVYARNGENGEPGATGRGIVAVASGQPTIEEEYTITPVTAQFNDGTGNIFNVYAKNGGAEKKYKHTIFILNSNADILFTFSCILNISTPLNTSSLLRTNLPTNIEWACNGRHLDTEGVVSYYALTISRISATVLQISGYTLSGLPTDDDISITPSTPYSFSDTVEEL